MAHNPWNIDHFEKQIWGDRERHVLPKYLWSISMKFLPWGWGSSAMYMSLHPLFMPSIPRHKICEIYQYKERNISDREISWQSLVLLQAGWSLVRCAPQPPIGGISWPSLVLHQVGLPQTETCGHECDNFFHIDQMYPTPSRDISWPSLVLLWAGWPAVRSTLHMRCQARFAFGQMSGQVNIMSDVPPNWKSHLDMERWLAPIDDFYTTRDLLPGWVTI